MIITSSTLHFIGDAVSSHIAESTFGTKVQQASDKMSVKTIFSQLLPAAPVSTPIQVRTFSEYNMMLLINPFFTHGYNACT